MPSIQQPRSSYVQEITNNSRKVFARPRNEVEKLIIDWHEEGRVVSFKPVVPKSVLPKFVQQPKPFIPKPESKVIDIRGQKPTRPITNNFPPKIESKPVPQPISLKKLSEEKDNQRKPDIQRVSALRDALKAVVGDTKRTESSAPRLPGPGGQDGREGNLPAGKAGSRPIQSASPSKQTGPTPEELKKILDV